MSVSSLKTSQQICRVLRCLVCGHICKALTFCPTPKEEICHLTYFQLIQNDTNFSQDPFFSKEKIRKHPVTAGTWKIPVKCFIAVLPRIRFSYVLPVMLQTPYFLEKYNFSPSLQYFLAFPFHWGYWTNLMEKAISVRTPKRVAFSIEFLLPLISLRILLVGPPFPQRFCRRCHHEFHLKLSV